jgi:putative salt-induced outer membrane protein YdiY
MITPLRSVQRFVLCAALLCAPGQLSAQEQPPEAWDVGADLGLSATRGSSYLTLFSMSLKVTRLETSMYELTLTAKSLYGENADSVVARRYQGGLTFDWKPDERVSPFVFVEAERDRFRKLDRRTNAGVGAKYVLWNAERGEASLSTAVLHDYQRFTQALPDGDNSTSNARWSVRARVRHEFRNGLALENVTFYKPVFDAFDDYDIDAATKASMKLSELVALSLSWTVRYDSTPPLDVRKDDQVLQIGLSLDF